MDWRPEVRSALPVVTGDFRQDADIREELAQHCADRYAELVAGGVDSADALTRTRRELVETARRRAALGIRAAPARRRGDRLAGAWRQFLQDVRYGVRSLARSPGSGLASILTLALAIGATTGIFSAVRAVLLRPLPYADPGRLVWVWEVSPRGADHNVVSSGNYFDWRARAHSFAAIGTVQDGFDLALTGDGRPQRTHGTSLTPSVFDALGVAPALGRTFRRTDGEPDQPRVVVLSHAFWRQRFGGAGDLIGRTITLDGLPAEVVGVMPPGFAFPSSNIDLWLPQRFDASDRDERRSHNYRVLARLGPGVTLEAANAEMRGIAAALARDHPQDMTNWSVNVVDLHADLVRGVRPLLLVLMAVVAAVLMIACANLATLQLARASRRGFEMAVRTAIGAGRGRILRQLITENAVVSAVGGALGLMLLAVLLPALVAAAPADIPLLQTVAVDRAVLAFAVGATLLSALLTGLAPAWHLSRADVRPLLQTARPGLDARGSRMRHLLVAGQVGLTLVLVVAAGLLVRSFLRLQSVDPGFDPHGVLTVDLDLPGARYPDTASTLRFYSSLIERVGALPGVVAAAGTTSTPGSGAGFTFSFAIEGRPSINPSGREDPVPLQAVTGGYFQTMRIPVIRGRPIDARDRVDSQPVAVINEALARKHWPDADPLGKRVAFRQGQSPWLEIVGVVGDTHDAGLAESAPPTIYVPLAQRQANWTWMSWQTLVVRAEHDPAALVGPVRDAVWALDPNLPLLRVATFDQALAENDSTRRFSMALLGAFAGLALLLGAIGVYGVLACAVGERRQEIGIRVALGARPRQVVSSIVRPALVFALAGLAAGLAAALSVVGFLRALLFGIEPADPFTFASAVLLLLGVAAAAAWWPARRAMRLDPVEVLRQS